MKTIIAQTSELSAALTAAELITSAGRYVRPLSDDDGTGTAERIAGLELVARLIRDGSAGDARSEVDPVTETAHLAWWSFFRVTSRSELARQLVAYLATCAAAELLACPVRAHEPLAQAR
jgi:hypothetical protein